MKKLVFTLIPFPFQIACILLIGFSLLGNWGEFYHLFELSSHFKPQYFLLLLAVTLCLALLRKWIWVGIGLFGIGLNALSLGPYYAPTTAIAGNSDPLKLLLANVYTGNRNQELLLDFVQQEKPDIVVLQEAGETWLEAFRTLRPRYPYVVPAPRDDPFGNVLFSRIPLKRSQVVHLGPLGTPSILIEFVYREQVVSLLSTHPYPPVSARGAAFRNSQLDAVTKFFQPYPSPRILIGDLNMTPWSPHFTRLLDALNLKDARIGFGILPSWPTTFSSSWFQIPIDHCLVTSDFQVLDTRIGPPIGSDHLPLLVTLTL